MESNLPSAGAATAPPAASATAPLPTAQAGTATPGQSAAALGQIVFFDNAIASPFQQIYIERADGSDVRHLVMSDANDLEPALSPDGTTVGFSRGPALFVVKVDGTGLKQIDQASCGSSCASDDMGRWSPDGTQIVFWRGLSDATGKVVNAGTWVMNADGSDTHQITLRNVIVPMQDDDPNWSPDGKRLVFQRDRYTTPETYAIFTVAIDGSDLRQVTPWALSAANPAWSGSSPGARRRGRRMTVLVSSKPAECVVTGADRRPRLRHREGARHRGREGVAIDAGVPRRSAASLDTV